MRIRLLVPLLSLVGVIIFAQQIPGCVMSASPKIGRVVDSADGRGIAGATVIASAVFSAGPVMHTSVAEGLYHDVTKTDQEGNYSFPMNWHAIHIGLPGTDAKYRWTVTVFKPGYAMEGDDIAWKEYDSDGWPRFLPPSLAKAPDSAWMGWTRVAPLLLTKQNLSPVQWALYWRQLLYTDLPERWQDENERVVRNQAKSWIVQLLCTSDTTVTMGYHVTSVVISFADDPVASSRKLSDLNPVYADMQRREQAKFKVHDVCEAMKDIGAHHVG